MYILIIAFKNSISEYFTSQKIINRSDISICYKHVIICIIIIYKHNEPR